MPDTEAISAQQELLQACRRTLWHYLKQQAVLSNAYVPPGVSAGIAEMRAQISAIKATLRDWGVPFEDIPGDEELPAAVPAPAPVSRALNSSRRVFISYKRHAFPDEPLARQLYDALIAAGHRPFIDQTIQVGADWAKTIDQEIAASDYFVILLSAASVNSEMVAVEVASSARVFRERGRARLLPVRLAYTAPLPYQISSDLDHIQFASWNSDADTPAVTRQLLEAIEQLAPLYGDPAAVPAGPAPSDCPRPYADPRFLDTLIEPSGGIKLRSTFYIERDGDTRLRRELASDQGTTTTIRAPRQTGKTSLLVRGIAQAQQDNRRAIVLDMQMVEARFLETLDAFLHYMATLIASRLRLDPALVEQAWQSPLGAPDRLTYFIEDHVFALDQPIVLAIDEADRLLAAPFRDTVFGLLRSWHNSRALNDAWDRLDILLVISTEPSLLIADQNQSPFNVGTKIVLEDLSLEQVAELNRRYRMPLEEAELPQLFDLLGGHPYLTSKALYTLVTDGGGWESFARVAPLSGGPFGDHLRS
jgi:hypothetical protein